MITDAIIKFSMEKNSVDNVSVIFIAFKNFENKMKDIDFEYNQKTKCQNSDENYDLNDMIIWPINSLALTSSFISFNLKGLQPNIQVMIFEFPYE